MTVFCSVVACQWICQLHRPEYTNLSNRWRWVLSSRRITTTLNCQLVMSQIKTWVAKLLHRLIALVNGDAHMITPRECHEWPKMRLVTTKARQYQAQKPSSGSLGIEKLVLEMLSCLATKHHSRLITNFDITVSTLTTIPDTFAAFNLDLPQVLQLNLVPESLTIRDPLGEYILWPRSKAGQFESRSTAPLTRRRSIVKLCLLSIFPSSLDSFILPLLQHQLQVTTVRGHLINDFSSGLVFMSRSLSSCSILEAWALSRHFRPLWRERRSLATTTSTGWDLWPKLPLAFWLLKSWVLSRIWSIVERCDSTICKNTCQDFFAIQSFCLFCTLWDSALNWNMCHSGKSNAVRHFYEQELKMLKTSYFQLYVKTVCWPFHISWHSASALAGILGDRPETKHPKTVQSNSQRPEKDRQPRHDLQLHMTAQGSNLGHDHWICAMRCCSNLLRRKLT